MKTRIAFLLFMLLCVSSCQEQVIFDEQAARREILAIVKDSEAGWNQGSIEKFMQGYWKSDSLRFASGGTISYGWQPVFQRYTTRYPGKAAMGELTFSNLDVTVISADAGLVFGKWQLLREQDAPWGLFTLFLRKTREGWRIVHDHTSSAESE
ncbi:MAG: YybH family protein [bacterium]